jgi:uncharacterized protein (TIGR02996 family)
MTHDDLIRAIIEDPDDDGPRLVYADFLDERNDPRGELIRVQCERATLAEDDPRLRHWSRGSRSCWRSTRRSGSVPYWATVTRRLPIQKPLVSVTRCRSSP